MAREAGLLDVETNAVLWRGKGLTWAYEHDEARSTLEHALALARQAGLRSVESETLRYLAIVANNQSRLAEAEQLLYQALEIRRADQDLEGEGSTLGQLGTVLYNQGRFDEGADALTQAREIFVRSGHKYKESITVGNLAAIATERGRLALARRMAEDGLRLSIELDDREGIGTAYSMLGDAARFTGDFEEVRSQMADALADRHRHRLRLPRRQLPVHARARRRQRGAPRRSRAGGHRGHQARRARRQPRSWWPGVTWSTGSPCWRPGGRPRPPTNCDGHRPRRPPRTRHRATGVHGWPRCRGAGAG